MAEGAEADQGRNVRVGSLHPGQRYVVGVDHHVVAVGLVAGPAVGDLDDELLALVG